MLTLIATTVLSLGAFQTTTAAPAGDAKAQLSNASAELAKAKSYSFTIHTETERKVDGGDAGGDQGGPGRRGGFGGPEPDAKCALVQGQPMHVTLGELDAYKDGDQVVYKDADGNWQLFDPESFRRGGPGGPGGQPGDRPGAGRRGEGGQGGNGGARGRGDDGQDGSGGQRGRGARRGDAGGAGAEGGGGRGRFGRFRGMFALTSVESPQELLTALAAGAADCTRTEADGKVVLKGTLTEDAARELGSPRGFGRRGQGGGGFGGGGGGPQMTVTGTYEVQLSGGAVQSIALELHHSGQFGDRSFESTTKRSVAISDVGSTAYEVPEAALSKFEI